MFPLLDATHRIGWSPASASKCMDDLETWRYEHYNYSDVHPLDAVVVAWFYT